MAAERPLPLLSRIVRNWWMRGGLAIALVIVGISFVYGNVDTRRSLTFSEVLAQSKAGKVTSIDVHGDTLSVRLRDDEHSYRSTIASRTDVAEALQNEGVAIDGSGPNPVQLRFHSGSQFWGLVLVVFELFVLGCALYLVVALARRFASRGRDSAPASS
jgi:ATP-dependent Zn protease